MIENQNSEVLEKITAKVRPTLSFMKQPVQVWAADELTDEVKWKKFLDDSWNISDRASKKITAIFIID